MKLLTNQTLKSKIILLFIIVSSLVLILQVGVFQHLIGEIIIKKYEANLQETVRQIGKRVELQLHQSEQVVVGASQDQVVKNYLKDLKVKKINYNIAKYKITNELLRLPGLSTIDNLYVFPVDANLMNIYYSKAIFTTNPKIKTMLMTKKVSKNQYEINWTTFAKNSPQISALVNIQDKSDLLGIIRFDFSPSYFNQMLDEVDLESKGKIYLVKDNKIIYAKDPSLINKNNSVLNKKDADKAVYNLDLKGWKMVGEVPNKQIWSQIHQFNRIFMIMVSLILLAILIFAMITARIFLRRLKKILKGMESVQQGNFNVQLTQEKDDEFSVLIANFNYMVERIQKLVGTVYNQQRHLREAEIMNLQANLNPHFLYNTLDMIYWMVIIKGEEEVGEAIVSLSSILRYSISHQDEFVTVAEDINQLENYLKIQTMRFEDKLAYKLDIEKEMLEYKIPKLLIQPLVENTIKYAFMNMREVGKVILRGFVKEDELVFEVIDNGVGIPKEKLSQIVQSLDCGTETKCGLGIRLVNERVKYVYGKESGVSIYSEENKGTRVTVKIRKKVQLEMNFESLKEKKEVTTITGESTT